MDSCEACEETRTEDDELKCHMRTNKNCLVYFNETLILNNLRIILPPNVLASNILFYPFKP